MPAAAVTDPIMQAQRGGRPQYGYLGPRPRRSCRAVIDGGFFDLADVTLVNSRRATGPRHALARPGILPFLLARSEYGLHLR